MHGLGDRKVLMAQGKAGLSEDVSAAELTTTSHLELEMHSGAS